MNGGYHIPGTPEVPRIPHIPREPEAVTPPPVPTVYVTERPAWEYKHVVRRLGEGAVLGEGEMNALGADGWELAGLFTDATSVHYYFKRPIGA
jgi:hypothetical protein